MSEPEITQIKIGLQTVGLVDLKKTFKEMAGTYAEQPDDIVAEELLRRLSKKNYISDPLQKEYGSAFVREFRKFLGQPFADENPRLLEIKVLGAGCVICDSLENDVMEVLSDMQLPADFEHVRDVEHIATYKVKGTPALLINNKIMCYGKRPSKNNIRKWLENTGYLKSQGGIMDKPELIKNITFSEPHHLAELVAYEEGRVVSRTFAQNPALSLTLFSFDAGEGVSTHTAPGDAMVQVLDGEALVNIDGTEMNVATGQVVVMPADIPHSVTAKKRFKMLLTVVKRPKIL
ncbi:MAG: thioredoxin family protein [Desulfobacterales bacterium]|nr:MAG: thioredoxin family protein [Desulfobacterales bacterium]